MSKKIIGITANIVKSNNVPCFEQCKLIRIFSDYSDSVIRAGGLPIIIPVTDDKDVLDSYIDVVDGLIISGGYDINPARYNEEIHEKLEEISVERDEYEFYLCEKAKEKSVATFGICRGHQLINVAYGGSLYQDISLKDGDFLEHRQQRIPACATHNVQVEKESKLYNILGENIYVNSFHHLAIKNLAEGFSISAVSEDGIIEAIERNNDDFLVMGIQWHPEALTKDNDKMLNIFKYFIDSIK